MDIPKLKSYINYYNETCNNEENKINIDLANTYMEHEFRMSTYSFISRIKNKISECVFNRIIHLKYINITNTKDKNILEQSYIMQL